jgi:hypothetical protein
MCDRFATEESLRKIHSVLKPGAALGLIWNVDDCLSFPFSAYLYHPPKP